MTTVWIHPEHKVLSPGRYGNSRSIARARLSTGRYRVFGRELRHAAYSSQSDSIHTLSINDLSSRSVLILSFVLLSLIALTMSIGVITFNLRSAWVEVRSMIYEESGAAEQHDAAAISSKAEFLKGLDEQNKRSLAWQVHFVTEIIAKRRNEADARRLAREIVIESYRSGFDPLLATSIIMSESSFDRHAVSHKGATGLMQLIPSTAQHVTKLLGTEWFGTHKLYEPSYNIKLGIAYMQHLVARYKGDLKQALIAYNWGPGNVDQSVKGGRIPPLGPIRYADQIISRQGEWAASFEQRQNGSKFINPEIILG